MFNWFTSNKPKVRQMTAAEIAAFDKVMRAFDNVFKEAEELFYVTEPLGLGDLVTANNAYFYYKIVGITLNNDGELITIAPAGIRPGVNREGLKLEPREFRVRRASLKLYREGK